jgi:outer membrane receptor protein involved in Fe transport
MSRATSAAVGCIVALGFVAPPAQAQVPPQDPQALEEVVVTARKRAESLQEIPLSISVLSADMIRDQGVARIDDIARLTPGLTFDTGLSRADTRPAIRGLQAERGRPSVAILLDGQDVSGQGLVVGATSSVNLSLVDLERIEVVRGPQSVLYGRSAFGGAINYISKRPTFEWESRVTAEVAEGNLRDYRLAVSGPVIEDRLALRANVVSRKFDGFYVNPVTGEDLGGEDTLGGAVSALFKPSDSVSIFVRYQYSDDEFAQSAAVNVPTNSRLPVIGGTFSAFPGAPASPCPANLAGVPPAILNACTRGVFTGEIVADRSQLQFSASPFTGRAFTGLDIVQQIASAEVVWQSDLGTVTYQFSWRDNDSSNLYDNDFSDAPQPSRTVLSLSSAADGYSTDSHLNHEIRWTRAFERVEMLVGAQWFREDSEAIDLGQIWLRNPNSIFAAPIPGFAPLGIRRTPSPRAFPNSTTRSTDYRGLFASLGWQATEALQLTFEGRYNREDADYTASGFTSDQVTYLQLTPMCPPGQPGLASSCGLRESIEQSKFSPRVSADYAFGQDVHAYASYARGFKPGGINAAGVTTFSGARYSEELVDAYEIGVKSRLADGRVLLNAALFYNDYTDQQIGIQRLDPVTNLVGPFTVNAGKVETQGLELDARVRLGESWTLSGAYALTDASFAEFVIGTLASPQQRAEAGNASGDFSGKDVARNSRHAVNVALLYRSGTPLFDDVRFVGELIGTYRSKRFTDETNLAVLPAYSLADLRLGLESPHWGASLYVSNLFGDDTIRNAQRFVDIGATDVAFVPVRAYLAYLPPERQAGLRFEYRFGGAAQ